MTDHTPHPLHGDRRNGLDNINTGLADSLDALTKGLADLFGDLGKGLVDFLNRLTAGEKDKAPTNAEKAEAAASISTWRELETDDEKRRALGEAAELVKGQIRAGQGADREAEPAAHQERELERVIPVPQYIRDMPDYETILAQQRALVAQEQARQYQGIANEARIEAADAREERSEREQAHLARQDPATPGVETGNYDPYAADARALDAQPMKAGQEIEGEVIDVAKVDGRNYYVIEQDGERLVVPAGAKPEHDKGDEITATRTAEGFETAEAYGYGR